MITDLKVPELREQKSARVLSETVNNGKSEQDSPIRKVTSQSGEDSLRGESKNSSAVNKNKGSRERKVTGVKDQKLRAASRSLNNATQDGVSLLLTINISFDRVIFSKIYIENWC